MNKLEFNTETAQLIGYYVYALVDSRNRQIFYIGKGKGNRVFDHANNVKEAINEIRKEKTNAKESLIKEIIEAGKEVKAYILRHEIKTESAAYEIESVLIDLLSHSAFKGHTLGSLTNIQSGHGMEANGIMTMDEVAAKYAAEPADLESLVRKGFKFLAIKINKTFERGITDDMIYEGVHFCWNVNLTRARKLDYVLAVYNGIIRGVYPCKSQWHRVKHEMVKVPQDEGRCYFDRPTTLTSEEQEQLNGIKAMLLNKRIDKLPKSQNPVYYFDKL